MNKPSIAKKRSQKSLSGRDAAPTRRVNVTTGAILPPPPRMPALGAPMHLDWEDAAIDSSGPDSRAADLNALTSSLPPPMVLPRRRVDGALLNLTNGFGNEQLTRPARGQWKRTAAMFVAITASLAIGYVAGAAGSEHGAQAEAATARTALASGAMELAESARMNLASAVDGDGDVAEANEAAPEAEPADETMASDAQSESSPVLAAHPSPRVASASAAEGASDAPAGAAEPPKTLEEAMVAPPFARDIAAASLSIAAGEAAGCGASDGMQGAAQVRVVFSTTGRVTSATLVGGPLLGTQAGSCVAVAMRRASVPAFAGESVAVTRTVFVR